MRTWLDHRIVRAIASVRTGIVLGFAASGVLALSSFTIPDPRGGAPLPFSESLEPFLASFQWRYAWFWPLAALLFLFASSVLLSTLRSSLLRRREAWTLGFVGVVLMHVGVVLGLVTHLAAGLSAKVEQAAVLGRAAASVAGHSIALVDMKPELNPDGSLRTLKATVSVDGIQRTLAHNEPLLFDGLRRFVLIQEVVPVAGGAVFSVDGRREVVASGESFGSGARRWVLGRISGHPSLRMPMVLVRPADDPEGWQWLAAGQSFAPGIAFEGTSRETGLAVVVRRNDGIPVLLLASVLFALGLVLFLRGRWRSG